MRKILAHAFPGNEHVVYWSRDIRHTPLIGELPKNPTGQIHDSRQNGTPRRETLMDKIISIIVNVATKKGDFFLQKSPSDTRKPFT
jgi:hypothetical protein